MGALMEERSPPARLDGTSNIDRVNAEIQRLGDEHEAMRLLLCRWYDFSAAGGSVYQKKDDLRRDTDALLSRVL